MFIRDNENVFDSRGIYFVVSQRHGKLNSSELRRFRSLITRRKRAVMSRERNDRTEVQMASSDPCRRRREIKRTDVFLSPVIPSASTCSAATSCLHYFLPPRPSLSGHFASWIVSFFREPPILLIRCPLFYLRASSLSPYVFSSSFFYMYNYSSKCVYSVLYSSM